MQLSDDCAKLGRGTASDLADTLLAAPDLGSEVRRFPGCFPNDLEQIVGLYVFGVLEHALAIVEDPVRLHAMTTSRVPGSRLGSAAMKGKWRLSRPVNSALVSASQRVARDNAQSFPASVHHPFVRFGRIDGMH